MASPQCKGKTSKKKRKTIARILCVLSELICGRRRTLAMTSQLESILLKFAQIRYLLWPCEFGSQQESVTWHHYITSD